MYVKCQASLPGRYTINKKEISQFMIIKFMIEKLEPQSEKNILNYNIHFEKKNKII